MAVRFPSAPPIILVDVPYLATSERAWRNLRLSDGDFHGLDVEQPIDLRVTVGRLDDSLKNLEA